MVAIGLQLFYLRCGCGWLSVSIVKFECELKIFVYVVPGKELIYGLMIINEKSASVHATIDW